MTSMSVLSRESTIRHDLKIICKLSQNIFCIKISGNVLDYLELNIFRLACWNSIFAVDYSQFGRIFEWMSSKL